MQYSVTARSVSILGIALLLNSVSAVVFAADIDSNNHQTGSDSYSSTEITESENTNVSIKNNSDIKNDVKLNLNTGGITVKGNSDVDDIETGDIAFGLKVANEANNNTTTGLENIKGSDSNISFSNGKTGNESQSENKVNLQNNYSLSLTNSANVNNKLDVTLNTGDIDILKNTKVGLVRTGDIKVLLDFTTKVNSRDTTNDTDKCATDCNKKEAPIPTPNATPTPELGKGGAETPGAGIVAAGANLLPFILLGLTFLLFLARPVNGSKVSL